MSRVKRWCFTLNNWTDGEYAAIYPVDASGAVGLAPLLDYAIVGKETSASGTPHLQGFVSFRERARLTTVRQLLPRAHWEVARNVRRAIEYCKKDGNFFELGEEPSLSNQGKRSDLDSFKSAVASGIRDRKQLREEHSFVCAQYPRFVESYVRDQEPLPTLEDHPLYPWQQRLVDIAVQEPDARVVHFIVDIDGNSGKSWLASYLESKVDRVVQVMKPGKLADMAYEYRENTEVFILDCPRSKQGDFIQYDFLESVKDGRLFSPKYESRTKRFKSPHVFVFMNEQPDMSKLSEDRYIVTDTN
jgi:Putative viral replication protein